MPTLKQSATTKPPKVQFATSIFFFLETDGKAELKIMRVGPLQKSSSCCWTTENASAIAGQQFNKASGVINFEPGEKIKSIEVGIIDRSTWSPTLEFKVKILEENVDNLVLAGNGSVARVRIVSVKTFPGKISKDGIVTQESLEKAHQSKLLLEYFRFNMRNPVVKRGFRKMFCIEQLHNLNFLLGLFLSVYLIDFVLNEETTEEDVMLEDKNLCLALLVTLEAVPFLILWWLDRAKKLWKVGGTSRAQIQVNLLRRYLIYSDESLLEVSSADLIMAITRDTIEVVHEGFMTLLKLSRGVGEIVCVFLFNVLSVLFFGKSGALLISTSAFFGIPIVLFSFLLLRKRLTSETREKNHAAQNAVIDHLHNSLGHLDMIADYHRRPEVESKFEQLIKTYNGTNAKENVVVYVNTSFASALALSVVLLWTVVGGRRTIHDPEKNPIGLFLATLGTLRSLGQAWASIYEDFTNISAVVPSLRHIILYLNLETVSLTRKRTAESRLKYTLEVFEKADPDADGDSVVALLDAMPIKVVPFSFGFKSRTRIHTVEEVDLPQGTFMSIIGHHHVGKQTFLQIVSDTLHPQTGGVIFPSHLRVVHVSKYPMFVSGTIWQNLLFGTTPDGEDGDEARVKAICKRLGMSDKIMSLATPENKEVSPWMKVLSHSECHKLCLARALVSNPQVLVMDKPTQPYDEIGALTILQCLKEHVTNKGVEHPPEKAWKRRPRTCIITASKSLAVEMSDKILEVRDDEKNGHATVGFLSRDRVSFLDFDKCQKRRSIQDLLKHDAEYAELNSSAGM